MNPNTTEVIRELIRLRSLFQKEWYEIVNNPAPDEDDFWAWLKANDTSTNPHRYEEEPES